MILRKPDRKGINQQKEWVDDVSIFETKQNLQIFKYGNNLIHLFRDIDGYNVVDSETASFEELFSIIYYKGISGRGAKIIGTTHKKIVETFLRGKQVDVVEKDNMLYLRPWCNKGIASKFERIMMEERAIELVLYEGFAVDLKGKQLTHFPFDYASLSDDFNCSDNELVSLVGSPYICESFDCSLNNLRTLKGSPVEVKMDFDCRGSGITSLIGLPIRIGGDLLCSNTMLFEVSPLLDCYVAGRIDIGRDDVNVVLNKYKNRNNKEEFVKELKLIDERYC